MNAGPEDPAVQRRRLRGELRELRNQAGLTQREVAEAMDWSSSKLIRIESGDVRLSVSDLRALLGLFGVTDKSRRDELVDLARTSRKEPWTDFRDVLSPGYRTYLGFESSTSLMRTYEPELVPGLLQTEEYARVILSETYEYAKEAIDRRWEVRLRRQELHERRDPPKMFFILDETVVRRHVGGQGVTRRQLERLAEWSREGHISLRVLPFTAGAHPGMTGPFTVLEFPDPKDDDLVYLESPAGSSTYRDDSDLTSTYIERFYGLEDKALTTDETRDLLDAAIAQLRSSKAATSTPAKS